MIEDSSLESVPHYNLLHYFKWFRMDIGILDNKGIIERITTNQYNWTRSKTSLAEYFKWIGKDVLNVPCGFWEPIEKVFLIKSKPIKRGSLRKLAGNNANDLKPDKSKDFKEIEMILQPYREQLETFHSIKRIIRETKKTNPEIIQVTLSKIKSILS